jgi:hypothetical protein
MKIIWYKLPCINDNEGFRVFEDKGELQPEKEEKVRDGDHLKALAEVNSFNQKQLDVSEAMPGKSFVFRKVLVE